MGFEYDDKVGTNGDGSPVKPLDWCNAKLPTDPNKQDGKGHNITILGWNIPRGDNGKYDFKKSILDSI